MLSFKLCLIVVFTTSGVSCCGNLEHITSCFNDVTEAIEKSTERHSVSWMFEKGRRIWNICRMYSEGMACMHKKLSGCKYLHKDVKDNLEVYLEAIVKNGVIKMCDNPILVQRYVENSRCMSKSRHELRQCFKMSDMFFKQADAQSKSNSGRFCEIVDELVDCGKEVTAQMCGHDVGKLFKDIVMNFIPEKSRGECLNSNTVYLVVDHHTDIDAFSEDYDNVKTVNKIDVFSENYDNVKGVNKIDVFFEDYDNENAATNNDDVTDKLNLEDDLLYDSIGEFEEKDNKHKHDYDNIVKKEDSDDVNEEGQNEDGFVDDVFISLEEDSEALKGEKTFWNKADNTALLTSPVLQLLESSLHSWEALEETLDHDGLLKSKRGKHVEDMPGLSAMAVNADTYDDDTDFAFSVLMVSTNDEVQLVNGASDLRLYIDIFFYTIGITIVYTSMF